jgi:hypothetical protein
MSLEEVRALLGPAADGKSDAEIDAIREDVFGFARVIFDSWRHRHRATAAAAAADNKDRRTA